MQEPFTVGDRFVLPSRRQVRVKRVDYPDILCEFTNDGGYPLLTGDDRMQGFSRDFLTNRCVRAQCIPEEA